MKKVHFYLKYKYYSGYQNRVLKNSLLSLNLRTESLAQEDKKNP